MLKHRLFKLTRIQKKEHMAQDKLTGSYKIKGLLAALMPFKEVGFYLILVGIGDNIVQANPRLRVLDNFAS